MTGKEPVYAILRHEPVASRVDSFAGDHTGRLKVYDAEESYQDADKLLTRSWEYTNSTHPTG